METTTPTILQSDLEAGGRRSHGTEEDEHEEVALSPPMAGTPRIMTTSPPPLEGNSDGSNGSGSGSGRTGTTSEWSVISNPTPRRASAGAGVGEETPGAGEPSTSRSGTLISPERPMSALEI